jgi:hypothetical protein
MELNTHEEAQQLSQIYRRGVASSWCLTGSDFGRSFFTRNGEGFVIAMSLVFSAHSGFGKHPSSFDVHSPQYQLLLFFSVLLLSYSSSSACLADGCGLAYVCSHFTPALPIHTLSSTIEA